jgi:hypothetical protein
MGSYKCKQHMHKSFIVIPYKRKIKKCLPTIKMKCFLQYFVQSQLASNLSSGKMTKPGTKQFPFLEVATRIIPCSQQFYSEIMISCHFNIGALSTPVHSCQIYLREWMSS